MSYEKNRERKVNSFVLFNNEKKTNDKHPDVSGTLTDENGKNWRIAGWKLKAKSGIEYIGGQVSEFKPMKQVKEEQVANANASDNTDDLPF